MERRGAAASVKAGSFLMGTDDPQGYAEDGEGPVHEVELAPFLLDIHTVTNASGEIRGQNRPKHHGDDH